MVKILVSHVSLVDGPVLHDDSVQMLFVDYSFLDIPTEDTETPCSVKKPTAPYKNIMFNFSKCTSAPFHFLLLSAVSFLHNSLLMLVIHCVSKKLCHFYFLNNSMKHWLILLTFGVQKHETTWHK